MASGVSIKNLTRHPPRVAGVPFTKIATKLVPGWNISLAFVGPARARALNQKLRGKDYIPNVLSYIAGDTSAEVIICPAVAKRQASDYQLSPADYLLLLFIHGLLHIKGWAHGGTMERWERTLLARYGATRSHRHRHRHVPGQNGRGRGGRR